MKRNYKQLNKGILTLMQMLALFAISSQALYANREEVIPNKDFSKDDRAVIGRIASFQSHNGLQKTLFGESVSAEGRWVREGESIFTIEGQRAKIVMDEDTVITLGPSSRIKFVNWTKRDGNNYRVRKMKLDFGFAWFTVTKIYSQIEPLVVETKHGDVSVRGTEFTVETGEGGHLIMKRSQFKNDIEVAKKETEVHVLEGEVAFAKDYSANENKRTLLRAGEFSIYRDDMDKPQGARKFDLAQFETYMKSAIPDAHLVINRRLSKEVRSQLAIGLEPVLPYTRSLETQEKKPVGRGLASEAKLEDNTTHTIGVIEKNSLAERKKYFVKKSTNRRKELLTPQD